MFFCSFIVEFFRETTVYRELSLPYKSGSLIIDGALKINSIEILLLVQFRRSGKQMISELLVLISHF